MYIERDIVNCFNIMRIINIFKSLYLKNVHVRNKLEGILHISISLRDIIL